MPKLIEAAQGRFIALSETKVAESYEVTLGDEGISCTCPGFTYRSACKHAMELALRLEREWESGMSQHRTPDEFALAVGGLQDRVFTSRYQAKELLSRPGIAAIRITLGNPRFELGYELAGTLMRLAPRVLADNPQWQDSYRAVLNTLGPESALKLLTITADQHPGKRIVLCCFEDVLIKRQPCHRRILANWLASTVGLVVPELRSEHFD